MTSERMELKTQQRYTRNNRGLNAPARVHLGATPNFAVAPPDIGAVVAGRVHSVRDRPRNENITITTSTVVKRNAGNCRHRRNLTAVK